MATGINWSECPIVERDPEKMGGVPTVRDWRIAADTIVEYHNHNASGQEISEWYELPLEDVRTILAYAEQYRHSAHPVR